MRRLGLIPILSAGGTVHGQETDSGGALVETAVALPLYFLLLFGLFETSLLLFTYCNATYACRQSARFASLRSTASLSPATVSQVSALVTADLFLSSSITPAVNVTYLNPTTGATATNTVGNLVEVSASWTAPLTVPYTTNQNLTITTKDYRLITR